MNNEKRLEELTRHQRIREDIQLSALAGIMGFFFGYWLMNLNHHYTRAGSFLIIAVLAGLVVRFLLIKYSTQPAPDITMIKAGCQSYFKTCFFLVSGMFAFGLILRFFYPINAH